MTTTLTLAPGTSLKSPGWSAGHTAKLGRRGAFSMSFHRVSLRMVVAGLHVGALALLFYGASFYTRDWRPVVAQADQPAAVQATTRSKAEPRSLPSKLTDLPAPLDPATTGALTRITPPVAAPHGSGDDHPSVGFGSAPLAGAPRARPSKSGRTSGRRLRLVPPSRSRRRLIRPLRSWKNCSRFGWLIGATEPGVKLRLPSEAAPGVAWPHQAERPLGP
jgi:hypothetical protein